MKYLNCIENKVRDTIKGIAIELRIENELSSFKSLTSYFNKGFIWELIFLFNRCSLIGELSIDIDVTAHIAERLFDVSDKLKISCGVEGVTSRKIRKIIINIRNFG